MAAEFVKRAVTKRTGNKRISDSWAAERERLLRVEVLPKIGSKRIGDITKADILGLLEGMVDRGSAVMESIVGGPAAYVQLVHLARTGR